MTGFIQRDLFNIRPQIISDSTRTGSDSIVLLGMQEYYKTNVSKANTGANSLIPTPNKRPNPSRNSPRGPLSQPSTSVESGVARLDTTLIIIMCQVNHQTFRKGVPSRVSLHSHDRYHQFLKHVRGRGTITIIIKLIYLPLKRDKL